MDRLAEQLEAVCARQELKVNRQLVARLQELADESGDVLRLNGNSKALFSARIDNAMLTALFHAIRETQGVPFSELDVSYNTLTDDCISALSELVEDYPGLRRVVVRSNDIGEQGCAQLAELLAHPGCRVEELDISGNKVGGKGVLSLAAMLEKNTSLRVLRINDTDYDTEAAVALTNALKVNQTLRELHADNPRTVGIEDDATYLFAKMLRQNTGLRVLSLGKHRMRDLGARLLAQYLQENSTLEELRLECNEIGAAGAEAVAALCIRGAALRRVSLAHNRVHDDGARAIAAALQSNVPLESLDLRSNGISDDGLCALAQGIDANTSLSRVLLWGNRFDRDSAAMFARLEQTRFRFMGTHTDFRTYEVDGVPMVCSV